MDLQRKIVLFDAEESYLNLLPLSYTRPVAEFRVGITKIVDKWRHFIGASYTYFPPEYLREKFPIGVGEDEEALFIAGNLLPDESLVEAVLHLERGEAMRDTDGLCAFRGTLGEFMSLAPGSSREYCGPARRIKYVFDIFRMNPNAIEEDYRWLVSGRESRKPGPGTVVLGPDRLPDGLPSLFIEEGAVVECAVINVKDGPVYIGRDAVVMEGSCLRGPLAVCDNAKIRMGAKIYGGTTFGPYCKVGGEVDNAVFFGYSNKAHDGYLGNAVIGEWCNIGAGTNSSNLKNDYSKIRIWNYASQSFMRTDLQFCGLIMGDHSKAGINCMFNTATVVGVGVNFHGCGYPRTFIPSFSAGSPEGGLSNVSVETFMTVAGRVMRRRGLVLDDVDQRLFERIYNSALRFKK